MTDFRHDVLLLAPPAGGLRVGGTSVERFQERRLPAVGAGGEPLGDLAENAIGVLSRLRKDKIL